MEGGSLSEGFVKVGSLGDFPSGSMKKIEVAGEDVLVANIAGEIYAISDTCTHRGCSLSAGQLDGAVVVCPCHGGRFDLETGKVVSQPPKKDETSYEVKVQDSEVMLRKK